MTDPKTRVFALLKSLETGDTGALANIDADNYVEHAVNVGHVVAGLRELSHLVPKGTTKVRTFRVFQDGDFVFAHSEYELLGPKVGFNVFRFERDKIVEHWSNLEERPSRHNPSGHTMTDGPMHPTDLAKTESNKTLVRAFVHDILVNGRMEKVGGYFHGDGYTQHNPNIGDGLSGLGAALERLAKQGVVMKYDRIHRVLGEGSFVLVMSEGSFANRPTSFFDLFRIESDRIAEHWDTIEPILERKNSNGKF
jgi:predicted SnoaL-like aldol condensation-catalyzing enzyme